MTHPVKPAPNGSGLKRPRLLRPIGAINGFDDAIGD
jgi:hypothetical protein